jgi:hypothetical protein
MAVAADGDDAHFLPADPSQIRDRIEVLIATEYRQAGLQSKGGNPGIIRTNRPA